MITNNYISMKSAAKKWLLWGILFLSIVGTLMHFVYKWSGKSLIIGIFAPVNESVWEHLKLVFWPVLLWWLLGYFILKKRNGILHTQWLASCAAAELWYSIIIISMHYTYTGALGIKSPIVDIILFYIAIVLGQGLAAYVYKRTKPKTFYLYASIILLAALAAFYIVCTFAPPHLPLFKDASTGNYGI